MMTAPYSDAVVSLLRGKQLPPNGKATTPPIEKTSRITISREFCARPREVLLSLPRMKFLERRA